MPNVNRFAASQALYNHESRSRKMNITHSKWRSCQVNSTETNQPAVKSYNDISSLSYEKHLANNDEVIAKRRPRRRSRRPQPQVLEDYSVYLFQRQSSNGLGVDCCSERLLDDPTCHRRRKVTKCVGATVDDSVGRQ